MDSSENQYSFIFEDFEDSYFNFEPLDLKEKSGSSTFPFIDEESAQYSDFEHAISDF